jgi:hypothetical protein
MFRNSPVKAGHQHSAVINRRQYRHWFWLLATNERPDPVNRAFGGVGHAIGEGAERGNTFRNGRAGMRLRCNGEPVKCSPRDLERRAECTGDA